MTEELCFIRCFTCGRVLANKWEKYQELLTEGTDIGEALDILGIRSYCCRRLMMCPAKIACNVDRQVTVLEDTCGENLTIATGVPALPSPLETIGSVPSVPRSEIILHAIPEISVPSIPPPGSEVVSEKVNRIIRSYTAW